MNYHYIGKILRALKLVYIIIAEKINPSLPKTVKEIVISGDYTQTSDNKPFLRFDNHMKHDEWSYSCLK